MSGGVDSSAAAWLLQQQGHEVIGLFMRSGVEQETSCELPVVGNRSSNRQGCCSASDAADARRVADSLGIPFHALNFQDAFGRIQDYFADEYLAGRTPNPCVMCNNWLKFGRLWEFSRQVGATHIASGHYAQVLPMPDSDQPALVRGRDPGKDQSYVLFGIDPELLRHVIFPVGNATKSEIRDTAERAGLRVFDKPDSQEICFVPDNDYAGLLRRHSGSKVRPGTILDTEGQVVGQHDGHQHFTIGQRRGLGVAFGYPVYVVERNPEANTITVGRKENLAASGCRADQTNWLIEPPQKPIRCSAKVRYNTVPVPAIVGAGGADELTVHFDEPVLAVTPGQAVVCYDGDRVLGGGWIRECLHGACSPT